MPRPDPDERFSLHPEDPEDVLRKLLGAEDLGGDKTDETPEENEANSY